MSREKGWATVCVSIEVSEPRGCLCMTVQISEPRAKGGQDGQVSCMQANNPLHTALLTLDLFFPYYWSLNSALLTTLPLRYILLISALFVSTNLSTLPYFLQTSALSLTYAWAKHSTWPLPSVLLTSVPWNLLICFTYYWPLTSLTRWAKGEKLDKLLVCMFVCQ